MQIEKPQLVIVPDEDYEYGLTHHAYPEYENELRSKNLVVLSKEDASSKYGITNPVENKIYIRNPYDGIYLDLASENLDVLFMEKKAIQIREVLIMFGVYSATLESTFKESTNKDLQFNVGYQRGSTIQENQEGENNNRKKESTPKGALVSGEAAFNSNSQHELNLGTKIELKPFRRQAKTPKEIRQYINTHGLGEECSLIAWLERYERDKIMTGAESLEVSFLEDLAKARNGVLHLKFLQDEASFNINNHRKQTHTFTKIINVDFNGPQDY